jgi:hypothetical protein
MGPKLPYCLFKKLIFFTALFVSVAALETGIARTSLIPSDSSVNSEDNFVLSAETFKISDDQRDKLNANLLFGAGWKLGSLSFEYNSNVLHKTLSIFSDTKDKSELFPDSSQFEIKIGSQESRSIFHPVVEIENGKSDNLKRFRGIDTVPPGGFAASTVAFTSDSFSGSEGTTVNLTVELIEAGDTGVSVDVVLVDSLSTVENTDIDNYSTQTIRFGDTENSTKVVSINLSRDSNVEGSEKAVFQLQNVSGGAIGEPSMTTLVIRDGTPEITINEFLTDPPADREGDANNDGHRHRLEDQFVEIINYNEAAVEI